MEAAPDGSTPITFVDGLTVLTYAPTPAARPPPPIVTNTKSAGSLRLSITSMAIVPLPAMILGSSNG
ncbi:hypothetical protein D3C87_2209560 [compost metagenome]